MIRSLFFYEVLNIRQSLKTVVDCTFWMSRWLASSDAPAPSRSRSVSMIRKLVAAVLTGGVYCHDIIDEDTIIGS